MADVNEEVFSKIEAIKASEYWVIRIKKRSALIYIGFVILIMWLVVGGTWLWNMNKSKGNIVYEDLPDVRIRNTDQQSTGAMDMAAFLNSQGVPKVEVVADTESSVSGVLIVVKPGYETLYTQLYSILEDTYALSSPSAELTQDSDIEAVIFYGNHALLK